MALTPKQQAFVQEYLIDLNATQAAIRAGYSARTAKDIGCQNLAKLDIANAIQAAMDKRAETATMDAQDTLATISRVIAACEQDDPVKNAGSILKGCELYGKHHKLFTDKAEVSGPGGGPIENKWTVEIVGTDKGE